MLMKVGLRGLAWAALLALPSAAHASEMEGPGRFCGYSPIIDMQPGERVVVLAGGMHGGTFRWSGDFGTLEVHGIGWASKPRGKVAVRRNAKGHVRFAQRPVDGEYVVALWNGAAGAAYFRSQRPFTAAQLAAIDRVDLFEEGQEPEGCQLRTIFSWE
jgi:hypothetical protein